MSKKEKFKQLIFDELFKCVGFGGFDQKFIDDHPNDWYTQKSWSEEQESSFKEWFISCHKRTFKSTKKFAKLEAEWFLFSYGWRTCEK